VWRAEPRGRARWTDTAAAELTVLAWWFQRLAFLRNAIAHGGEIDPERYTWNGVSHSQGRPTAEPS
jgi:hypothetical protein